MPDPTDNPFDNSGGSNAGIPAWTGTQGKASWARAAVMTLARKLTGEDWSVVPVSADAPMPVQIVGAGVGNDIELATVAYRCKTAFTGAAVGALITATRVINASVTPVVQVGATVWRNESTDTQLAGPPAAGNLEVVGLGALTDAQLRASPLPLPTGASTEATQAAVLAALAGTIKTVTPTGLLTVVGTVTRPADVLIYAAGDLIANSTTSGQVVPIELVGAARGAGEAIRIERVRLRKTGTSLTAASFRVHLFRTLPVVSVGDNGVFDASNVLALADIAGYVGTVDVVMDKAAAIGARGVGVPASGSGITCEAAGTTGHEGSLYALIEARAAYQGVSAEAFTVTIEGSRS